MMSRTTWVNIAPNLLLQKQVPLILELDVSEPLNSVVHGKHVFAGPPSTSYMMVAFMGPSSIICCPFHGHISKTKQDRPIVIMERY